MDRPEPDIAKSSFPAQSQGFGQGCQLCLQGRVFNFALSPFEGRAFNSRTGFRVVFSKGEHWGPSWHLTCFQVPPVCSTSWVSGHVFSNHSEPSLQARNGEIRLVRNETGSES